MDRQDTHSIANRQPREKLQIYRKTLDFAAKAAVWASAWDKKHALVDHLSRASESIVLNLAAGNFNRE